MQNCNKYLSTSFHLAAILEGFVAFFVLFSKRKREERQGQKRIDTWVIGKTGVSTWWAGSGSPKEAKREERNIEASVPAQSCIDPASRFFEQIFYICLCHMLFL